MKDYVAPAILATLMLGGFTMISAQISSGLAGVSVRVDDVNTRIDDVNTRIDDINTRIDDITAEVAAGRAEIRDLRVDMRDDHRRFDDRLRGVEIGFGKIDQRLLTLERVFLPAQQPGE